MILDWRALVVLKTTFLHRFAIIVMVIAGLTFASALAVVYVKNQNRIQFVKLQQLKKTQANLYTQWTQLLLEESTWTSYSRIEREAQQNLAMEHPSDPKVIIIEPQQQKSPAQTQK